MDRVARNSPLGLEADPAAGIEVAVDSREVAGRDVEADTVAGREDVARGPEVDSDLAYLTRFHEHRAFNGIAVPGAQDALAEVDRATVRVDVDEACGEVRVGRIR